MKAFWNEKLGLEECPYMTRWGIAFDNAFSIRLHHWISSDDDRFFHDHPWGFITFVLKGGYTDVSPEGEDKVKAPAVRYRPALHRHTVQVNSGGAWTLVITGRHLRAWGFWDKKRNGRFRFVPARTYFFKYGHHPCLTQQPSGDATMSLESKSQPRESENVD